LRGIETEPFSPELAMRATLVRFGLTAVLVLPGCGTLTELKTLDLNRHRAAWEAQGLTDYSYVYELDGFLINYAGKPIRLEVRQDTVRSAVVIATGDTLAGHWPTIDDLFDQAAEAQHDDILKAITFDPVLSYPVRMDLSGPPDASGSVLAGQLSH
jgi:uncharacterized protein DUF6174